jgi:glycosyltransferase involved in cell wall biosynthesis
MKDEKTLVILTPGFPSSENDTTCLPLQQQLITSIKELNPQLKITVLSFQYPYHTKIYSWKGIEVIPFDGRNSGRLKKVILRKKILFVLDKINTRNKIAGLLSFWCNECALIGKKFSDKHGLKHLCWILGQDATKENNYPRKISFSSQELAALSDFIKDEFERNHGVSPAFVIPPGVDKRLFDNAPKEKTIDILGVGSLIPLKQYEVFIEVIAGIKKQIPGIKSMIVGKGPEDEKLQAFIKQQNLHGSIQLTGELSYPVVLQMMERAKVFLHPSSYEGFGAVCLEALCAGAHVISFCQPMQKIIPHWHIVKTKEEMTKKGIDLLKDNELNHSPVTPFSIKDCAKSFAEIFNILK